MLFLPLFLFHFVATEVTDTSESCVTFSPCPFWQFACESYGCINMRKFCDGNIDCPDGSDEKKIVYNDEIYSGNSASESFRCNNLLNEANLSCALPVDYACDGILHCADKEDENFERCGNKNRYVKRCHSGLCMNNKVWECSECENAFYGKPLANDRQDICASSIFQCASDGKCLKASQFCDGIKDCVDGSDEMSFVPPTDQGILCKNNWNFVEKQCYLPWWYMCDGINHCENRIDECQNCTYSFICENNKCIPSGEDRSAPTYINDGMDDCGDGSDEDLNFRFSCHDEKNSTLPFEKFCDGVIHCHNGLDEIYLNESNSNDGVFCQNKYLYNNLTCLVSSQHLFDGHTLCKDFIDERNNDTEQDFFRCANGDYIHLISDPLCNYHADCCDASDECFSSCKTFHCHSDNKCLPFDKFCDGISDCSDGSDEITTDGNHVMCSNYYNLYNGKCQLPKQFYCDGIPHCISRIDECTPGCKESFFCGGDDNQCIERNYFCNGIEDCLNGLDELYNGHGFKCPVTKIDDKWGIQQTRVCVLDQRMINDSTLDCDDKSDEPKEDQLSVMKCLQSPEYISLKQICDGTIDCSDLSDECLCEKNFSAENTICNNLCLNKESEGFGFCSNCSYGELFCDSGSKCLESHQICNKFVDCNDSSDEHNCPKKTQEKSSTSWTYEEIPCTELPPKQALKCNGKIECMDLSDECYDECNSTITRICTKLVKNPDVDLYHCPNGTAGELIHASMICDGVEDCVELNGQNRSGFSRENLSVDEKYCPYQFLCNHSRPIDQSLVTIPNYKVCDGNIDCEMAEDELQETCGHVVTDRFYCENPNIQNLRANGIQISRKNVFALKSKMFNGKKDCTDGSDECPLSWLAADPFASRYRMIKDVVLSDIVWIMAILALVGNLFVVLHTVNTIICRRRLSSMMKTNCILVLNLALSDLLMGIYLLDLAIRNTSTCGRYCEVDKEWRSGNECQVIGTLAMISIQCSVLILMILTTYRVLVVLRPFSADFIKCRYAGVLVASAWIASITLACLPHSPMLQQHFISSAWISPGVGFFKTDTPHINVMKQFVKRLAAYGNVTNDSLDENLRNPSEMINYINSLYPDFSPKFQVKGHFGFYSSNSVCLPQIFVTVDDVAWGYSFGIITFDFIAFFYILLSYIIIYHDATRIVAICRNNDENRTMQARITRLVLTDFICWMPVCFMAFLSLAGVAIPPVAYAFSAIVLLPINSALNPILYSNIISVMHTNYTKRWTDVIQRRVEMGRKSISRVRQRGYFSRASTAGMTNLTMTTNDVCPPADGTPLFENAAASVMSQNCNSVSTTTTRL